MYELCQMQWDGMGLGRRKPLFLLWADDYFFAMLWWCLGIATIYFPSTFAKVCLQTYVCCNDPKFTKSWSRFSVTYRFWIGTVLRKGQVISITSFPWEMFCSLVASVESFLLLWAIFFAWRGNIFMELECCFGYFHSLSL